MKDWGILKQRSLDSLAILVVGAGGLGCSVALSLAGSVGSGVRITIMDNDAIELSNLHRQIAYSEEMVGRSKAECLAEVCRARNSLARVIALTLRMEDKNADELVEDHDVIFDCTDNVESRITISDAWVRNGRRKTVISASCVAWSGQLVVLGKDGPICMRCIYGEERGDMCVGQCASEGVMGPVVGILGNYQFLELMKLIANPSGRWISGGNLRLFDFASNFSTNVEVPPSCSLCKPGCDGDDKRPPNSTNPTLVTTHSTFKVTEIEPHQLPSLHRLNPLIIDVRQAGPFRVSRLRNSVNLPFGDCSNEGLAVGDRTVLVVCRRGVTSLRFARWLSERIQREVLSLRGGLEALGLPLV